MNTLSPYIHVIRQALLNSLSKLLSFRLSFALFLLAELASFLTFYYTIDFLFLNISAIGSWDRTRFMFFIFWWQCVMNLHSAFVAPNFWNLSEEIRNGNLDFRLVRPLGSLFDAFTAITRPVALLVYPVNVGFLIYYGDKLGFSYAQWSATLPLLLLSFVVVVLVELAISMSMFWTTEGDGVNFVRIQGQQITKWPDFLYPRGFRLSLTFALPLLASCTFCVRALFGQGDWWEVPFLLASCCGLWCLVTLLWRAGLARYESASS